MGIREKINHYFKSYPIQRKVAHALLQYGLKVKENNVYCGPIEQADSKLARAIGVDRRGILATIKTIQEEPEMKKLFSKIEPATNLKDVAPQMGWGVIEIIPEDPSKPGILAAVSAIIAEKNISVRQAMVDDYEMYEEPRLYIITESPVPTEVIPKIKDIEGVKGIATF